ncbi:hypothetical protein QQY66_00295 [Streptomyces sp. DG2A-72]|uniref:hypothetical protein n=1 Tax=Streptomyces sp. DG2A-72 TaxID=3051386 RepID=UPI00265B7650|nr:hypothetical protein [Streptomyces sp. DG2A-72]MDO0930232.1 hypothetical protein [Streptomyces sp. DG2A-72]
MRRWASTTPDASSGAASPPAGSAWSTLALYYASSDRYEDSLLPTGGLAGSPEDALDCSCGVHLTAPGI